VHFSEIYVDTEISDAQYVDADLHCVSLYIDNYKSSMLYTD
jgi:hypothetical protein